MLELCFWRGGWFYAAMVRARPLAGRRDRAGRNHKLELSAERGNPLGRCRHWRRPAVGSYLAGAPGYDGTMPCQRRYPSVYVSQGYTGPHSQRWFCGEEPFAVRHGQTSSPWDRTGGTQGSPPGRATGAIVVYGGRPGPGYGRGQPKLRRTWCDAGTRGGWRTPSLPSAGTEPKSGVKLVERGRPNYRTRPAAAHRPAHHGKEVEAGRWFRAPCMITPMLRPDLFRGGHWHLANKKHAGEIALGAEILHRSSAKSSAAPWARPVAGRRSIVRWWGDGASGGLVFRRTSFTKEARFHEKTCS